MSENKNQNNASKKEKVACVTDEKRNFICNPPVRNITHPLRYYEFTRDEIKVLEECDKESFYQRCIPYSTLFATATYAAIKYDVCVLCLVNYLGVVWVNVLASLRQAHSIQIGRHVRSPYIHTSVVGTYEFRRQVDGILKKNPHLGVFPKVLIAFIFGHFYGRYAYIPLCEAKLRQLPSNSYLGNIMRYYYCERTKNQP